MAFPQRPVSQKTGTRTLLSEGSYGHVYKDAQQRTLTKQSKSAAKNQTLDYQIGVYRHLNGIPDLHGIIPSLIGSGKQQGRSYLTMQYKKDYKDAFTAFNEMQDILYAQPPPTRANIERIKRKARAMGYGILDAISRFHHHDIAHGDVKFENFLTDDHGNVNLIDFGFTVFDPKIMLRKRGTFPYTPPQFARKIFISRRDVMAYDFWATGIIIAHLALLILMARHLLLSASSRTNPADQKKDRKAKLAYAFLNNDILKRIFPDRGPVFLPDTETLVDATKLLMNLFPQYEFNLFDPDPQKRFIRRKPSAQQQQKKQTTQQKK